MTQSKINALLSLSVYMLNINSDIEMMIDLYVERLELIKEKLKKSNSYEKYIESHPDDGQYITSRINEIDITILKDIYQEIIDNKLKYKDNIQQAKFKTLEDIYKGNENNNESPYEFYIFKMFPKMRYALLTSEVNTDTMCGNLMVIDIGITKQDIQPANELYAGIMRDMLNKMAYKKENK